MTALKSRFRTSQRRFAFDRRRVRLVGSRDVRVMAWPATDIGRVRSHNEDSHRVSPELGLVLVADGMGGHAGGAHASQVCVDVVNKVVARGLESLGAVATAHQGAAVADMLCAAASEASARIFDQAAADPRLQGMGTTLSGLFVHGDRGFAVHVGDSRVYLLRQGAVRQLTNDHSLLNEQLQAGLITEQEAETSDYKHIITRSVGFERFVDADVVPFAVSPGDAFLLCSDGMSNYVTNDEIAAVMRDHWYADVPQLCIDMANRRGGDDNITVVTALVCNDRDLRRPRSARWQAGGDTLPPPKKS